MEQRGHGASGKATDDFSRDAYVRDATAVADWLGPPLVLIGQSMGGQNAFLVAARRPDLARALLVAEATPAPSPGTQEAIRKWLDSWPVPFPTLADAKEFFDQTGLHGETWIEVLEERADGYWPQFEGDAMVQSVADQDVADYRSEWATIEVPTLVVRAPHAPHAPTRTHARRARV